MKWINFLHIYQLSNTDGFAIKEATEESYKRIIRELEVNKKVKFTINITGCLVEKWKELGYEDFIKKIKKLVKRGQIELVASTSYHCLMPLTPAEEIRKQIEENTKIIKETFGKFIKLKGFFMPEMAYSVESAKIVKDLGFEWIILDEIAYNGNVGEVDCSKVYLDKNTDLKVVLRSRKFSNCYLPRLLCDRNYKVKEEVIVSGTDGELYGLRHQDPWKYFENLMKLPDLKTDTISNYIETQEKKEKSKIIELISCNWESTEKELKDKKPYFSWFNKENEVQTKIWELARYSHEIIENYDNDDNYIWARFHLSRGLASCTFWWASAKDFSYIFGPYAWNPDEIERGVNELIRAIRSLENVTSRDAKIKAESLYVEIKKMIWEKHWTYFWKKDK